MINNKTYATKATATRGAKRLELTKFDIVPAGDRFELRDLSRPLYDASKRVRSKIDSPVRTVWDICIEFGMDMPRKDILAKAIEAGVSVNTAKSQYQSWRKAAGLVKAAV